MFQNNLLMGAAAAASGGASLVSVGKSALFSTTSQELERTPSTAGNLDKWTFSAWVYFCAPTGASSKPIFGAINGSANQQRLMLTNTGAIQFDWYSSSSYAGRLITSQLLRDIGWYHIVAVYDSGNGISSQRQRLYLNGERITAFSTEAYVSQNLDGLVNSAVLHQIGLHDGLSLSMEGYIAEAVLLDGTAAEPTSFGVYDSSGLFWTPLSSETIKELTFGTNGFYLSNEYDVSSNMTTFVDSGPTAHTITTIGNTTHSSRGQKVQNSVIYSDGSGDGFKLAQSGHADFTFGTGDFCIEGWFNRIALSGTSNYSYVFDFRYASNDAGRPACYMDGSNNISYDVGNSNKIISTTDPSLGAWFHLAIARNSSTTTMYLNGTSVGSFSDSTDYLVGRPWYFEYPQSNAYCFNGYATEIRVSKGVPRYTGNFTPSTTAFVSDSYTSLLVHSNKFFGAANDSNTPPINFINTGSVTTTTHTPTNGETLFNPINTTYTASASASLSNGNRSFASASAYRIGVVNLNFPKTGKWWVAVEYAASPSMPNTQFVGITRGAGSSSTTNSYLTADQNDYSYTYQSNGYITKGSASPSTVTSGLTIPSNGDFMLIAFDADNQTVKWYLENSLLYTLDLSSAPDGYYGNDGGWSFAVASYTSAPKATLVNTADYGYTPPTGYEELNTTNIASATTRTASDTTKYFDTILYEGNGVGQRVGQFQPFGNAFTVAKSALFQTANSESLTRTPSGAGNRRTWTFSTWIKFAPTVASFTIFNGYGSASDTGTLDIFWSSNYIYLRGWNTNYLISNMEFVDESEWGNLVITLDTTQSTDTNRAKGYWNGVELTWSSASYPSQNVELGINQAVLHSIGAFNNGSGWLGAYLAETVFVDGTALTPSSFGQTDTSTNRWIPKAVSGLSLGTNGFYLDYSDSSDLGEDQTGSNDFTNNNTVTQSGDSPTINANVWNPSESSFSGGTFSNGNRTVVTGSSQISPVQAGLPISSGKWYCEVVPQSSEASFLIGLTRGLTTATNQYLGQLADDVAYYGNGNLYMDGAAAASYGASYAQNDVIGMAIDLDNNTLTYYKNGSSQGVIGLPSPSSVSHPYYVACGHYWSAGTGTYLLRSLSSDWTGTAPTDHLAIIQDNFTSSDQFISAFSWIKNRDATDNWQLFDRVRGPFDYLQTNTGVDQTADTNSLQQFLAGGAQIGNNAEINTANESIALWNFMFEATGTGTAISDGMTKISDSSTTAITQLKDTTLGMSITTYVGLGSHPATIQHGLGVAPELVIVSKYSGNGGGYVISPHFGSGNEAKWLTLFGSGTLTSNSTVFNGAYPTSSTFSVGTNAVTNGTVGATYVAYCFAPSQFISCGSYTNNNNADGPFVPTVNSLGIPIQPSFILAKTLASASWMIFDNKRIGFNVDNNNLLADTTAVESTADKLDIVTGGFKLRTNLDPNYSTSTTVYMAIGTPIINTDGRIIAGR